tara:strand:+ start:8233 stop:8466 length:234 start_codon:yes stop_codon:yes gene_type:complete
MKHLKLYENFTNVPAKHSTQTSFNSEDKRKIIDFIDSRVIDFGDKYYKEKGYTEKRDFLEASMGDLYTHILNIIRDK